jgi:hypothetical protein
MRGFRAEFMYPSYVMKCFNLSDGQQETQNGTMTYTRKNGSQHTTNTPMIIPGVLAARLSLDNDILCFMLVNRFIGANFLVLENWTLYEPDTAAGVAGLDARDPSFVAVVLQDGRLGDSSPE